MATQVYHNTSRLQRRHFELIAEIIRKELEGECREKAAYAFAHILPTTNGKFNPQRFLRACEVKAFKVNLTAQAMKDSPPPPVTNGGRS